MAVFSAASALLRRFGRVPVLAPTTRRYISNWSLPPLPTRFKTPQTQTTPEILHQATPMLLLGNLSDPKSRYLYDVGRERTAVKVDLPDADGDIVGSSHGFLISAAKGSGKLHATNLVTRLRIPLPSVDTLPDAARIRKAIFSPKTDTVVLSLHRYRVPIALARVGDESWTAPRFPANTLSRRIIRDVTFHRGNLYAVHTDGTYAVFDLEDPHYNVHDSCCWDYNYRNHDFRNSYMVASPDGDDLFLVSKTTEDGDNSAAAFTVFKLDAENEMWDHVDSIGDLALFIGSSDHSIALHAPDFPNIKPNSIYFADGNSGVLDLNDKSVRYFSFADGVPELPRSVWLMPPSMD